MKIKWTYFSIKSPTGYPDRQSLLLISYFFLAIEHHVSQSELQVGRSPGDL